MPDKHKPRTEVFLVKENQVLLGYKKTGFGKSNYVGIGGKVESNETIEAGAVRELMEETEVRVDPANLSKVAVFQFLFPHVKDGSWDQEVHVFLATQWEGEPCETDEIVPKWFAKADIPWDKMWDDAHYWLPRVLNGEQLHEEYQFDKNLKVAQQRAII